MSAPREYPVVEVFGPTAQRIARHAEVSTDGCWRWTGAMTAAGYGVTGGDAV